MKYSKALTKQLCDKLIKGLNRDDACCLVGINQDTFYEWLKDPKKPEFSEHIKRAESEFKETNLYIIQKASVKSWQAASWLLERRHQKEFALQRFEVTGRGGAPLIPVRPTIDLSGLTRDQLDALIIATSLPMVAPPADGNGSGSGNGNGNGHNGQAPH
jgi:hypothetical protein